MRNVRHSTEADATTIMAMYDHSRNLMRQAGNTTQWVGYPTRQQLQYDIEHGNSYVVESPDGQAVGTFALSTAMSPPMPLLITDVG